MNVGSLPIRQLAHPLGLQQKQAIVPGTEFPSNSDERESCQGGQLRAGIGDRALKQGCKLVIKSVNRDGRQFRPSDWIERISTQMATFGPDHRLHYSTAVQPKIIDGEKCLVVNQSLKDEDPAAYEFIMAFVEANRLQVIENCEIPPDDIAS